jgi:hypothetical protein
MINESVFLPSLIAAGPLVLGVGDEGVADGLIQLERTGHAVEAAGLVAADRSVPAGARRRATER